MTQRWGTVWAALVLFATACDGSPPAEVDGGPDGGVLPADDAGPGTDGAPADGGPDGGVTVTEYPLRDCTYTVRYAPPVGTDRVRIAGDFTSWEDGALDLRDDDGDGTFELTLLPNARLGSGQIVSYRLILGDDNWIIDPGAPRRRYGDSCQNGSFVMPACDAGPEIRASELTSSFDAGTSTGSARVSVTIYAAVDEVEPTDVTFTLDDAAVDAADLTFEAGRYDVSLDGLAEGRHVLSVRATDAEGRAADPVDLPFWVEAEPFEWRDATMYMMVVDRFANGDSDIDDPVGAPVEYPADFHGGDLQGATEVMRSGYFEDLGINVIWLSPINQQAEGDFPEREGDHRFAGYHGYWPSRGRDVEPRFGGNAALRDFVDEAHSRGIRVLFDLINNQVHDQHEYYAANPGWFRTSCVCGIDPGCGWSERPLDCLFASYLPDIDWRVPGAETQFIADAVFWISELGVDGFRIDAVKHVETSSIFNLRDALSRRFEQGGERVFLVGETAVGESDSADYGCGESFSDGYDWIDAYVGDRALDGQFDFPTHHRLQDGLVKDYMQYTDVEAVVQDLQSRYSPDGLHVRFLGTHDSNRLASRASDDAGQACRWPFEGGCGALPSTPTDAASFGRIRRAFTILYTTPGIPFLYYGDEIAMPGGLDPDNRRDMVFTGPLASVAMGETTLSAEQLALRDELAALGVARRDSVALRRGRRVPLLATADLLVYAYAHDDRGELAVVAVNRGAAVSGRSVAGLTTTIVGDVTALDAAAGSGTATLSGTSLTLDLPAGGSAVFLGR